MNIRHIKLGVMLFGAFLLSSQAHALLITDTGVVGTIDAGTQNSSVANEIEWAQYLLDLANNTLVTVDGNTPLDGASETYQTRTDSTEYSGTLSGGVQGPSDSNIVTNSGFEYVLAKYDGQNAGYVLYNMADWGSLTLSLNSADIWGTGEQYAISHWTGFNSSVPAPAILGIMGIGLMGMVTSVRLRRRKIS